MTDVAPAHKLGDEDVSKFLATHTHLGSNKCNFQMEQYMFARRPDGNYIINLQNTWDKLVLAARAIAAVENPSDVAVIGGRPYAQRGLLKFAAHTGSIAIAGRFTPGTFTNQIQRAFKEPRLLVVVDPYQDHQAITEASYVNIPVIAFCNSDSPLKLVDIAIPCNNKGKQSIGLMLWMLAREVLVLRGRVSRAERGCHFMLDNKVIMPDLYFYRDQEEEETKEGGDAAVADEAAIGGGAAAEWGQETVGVEDHGVAAVGISAGLPDLHAMQQQIPDWAAEAQQWTSSGTAGAVGGAEDTTHQWGGAGGTW